MSLDPDWDAIVRRESAAEYSSRAKLNALDRLYRKLVEKNIRAEAALEAETKLNRELSLAIARPSVEVLEDARTQEIVATVRMSRVVRIIYPDLGAFARKRIIEQVYDYMGNAEIKDGESK